MKAIAAIILAILTALPARLASAGLSGLPERAQVGSSVAGFSSTLITGEGIDGSVFAEHSVSAVVFWATWSEDCRRQIAILDEIGRQHPEYGVFGLLYEDATSTQEAALAFMEENGYRVPVFVRDEFWDELVSQAEYIPQCFLVDETGTVVEVWHAAFSSAEVLLGRLRYWSGSAPGTGDADLDGVLTALDALLIMRCSMGLITMSPEQAAQGDIDGDGSITALDALFVLRVVMDL